MEKDMKHYVIGVDYGSDSARTIVVDARTGDEIAQAVVGYPRWLAGKYQDAGRRMFRQHPLDYLEALTVGVRNVVEQVGEEVRRNIAAISIDATGSTPCPVDEEGTPLALLPEFSYNPGAMFHLWKDHTATREADDVTRVFRNNPDGVDYTVHQGPYASEWFWAKILYTIHSDPDVRAAAYSWVEHSDWLPSLLAGNTKPETMYRCACAAGHKAYWHSDWNGLPSEACLAELDPYLVQVRRTYGAGPLPSTHRVGTLTPEWAQRLGLEEDVIVGGSSCDAHAGAVGAGVNGKTMVVNLGTSAVDLFAAPGEKFAGKDISWVSNAAESSIIPGLTGLETGQASFGDVFAWFKKMVLGPSKQLVKQSAILSGEQKEALIAEMDDKFLIQLQQEAEKLDTDEIPAALDWFNGRRYPCVNELARSAIADLNMGTTAAQIYYALVASAAFGQKRILDALAAEGIVAERLVAVGGIAQKSSFLMQMLADVLGKEIHVSRATQACARGAAIYAAVSAGLYGSIEEAQEVMCEGILCSYVPDAGRAARYGKMYARYLELSAFADPKLVR